MAGRCVCTAAHTFSLMDAMPVSTRRMPCSPVCTVMLPPAPMMTCTLPRTGRTSTSPGAGSSSFGGHAGRRAEPWRSLRVHPLGGNQHGEGDRYGCPHEQQPWHVGVDAMTWISISAATSAAQIAASSALRVAGTSSSSRCTRDTSFPTRPVSPRTACRTDPSACGFKPGSRLCPGRKCRTSPRGTATSVASSHGYGATTSVGSSIHVIVVRMYGSAISSGSYRIDVICT